MVKVQIDLDKAAEILNTLRLITFPEIVKRHEKAIRDLRDAIDEATKTTAH